MSKLEEIIDRFFKLVDDNVNLDNMNYESEKEIRKEIKELIKQWALELLPKKALRNDATGDAYNCAMDEIKARIEEE